MLILLMMTGRFSKENETRLRKDLNTTYAVQRDALLLVKSVFGSAPAFFTVFAFSSLILPNNGGGRFDCGGDDKDNDDDDGDDDDDDDDDGDDGDDDDDDDDNDDSIDDKEDDFQIIKTTVFFLLIEDLLIEST